MMPRRLSFPSGPAAGAGGGRKRRSGVLLGLGLLLCCSLVRADAREVRVGIYENPPKVFHSADGEPAGLLIDLLREIATREDWQLVFVPCAWQGCLSQLDKGDIDLMPDVAYTGDRARRFDFHRTPALSSWSQLYRRSSVRIDSISDLEGKRIALLAGSVQEQALQAMLDSFGLHFEIVPTASPEEAFEQAGDGRADAAVASHHFGGYRSQAYGLAATPIVFLPAQLYFVTATGRNADLLAGIDTHLEPWLRDGYSPYYQATRRWGGQAPTPLVPAAVLNSLWLLGALGVVLSGGVLLLRGRVRAKSLELARLNRQLSATLDAIPDPLFEIDLEGRYIDVHVTRSDPLLASAEKLRGRTLTETLPAQAAALCMDALQDANTRGWSSGREIELPSQQGPRWFELSIARKQTEVAGPPHFIVLLRDITARRQAEAGVQRLTRLYATLSQCNQAIVRCTSQAELLQQICHDAVVFGGMRMVWIGMIDPADGVMRPLAAHGEGMEYIDDIRIVLDPDSPLGRGPSGTAMREDRPVWCLDFANDPTTTAWHARGRRYGWLASAALPLHCDGKVVGALNLYAGEHGAFDEAAQRLLVEMAMDIDFALDRFRQDAERERLALAIVDSEQKYRELAESINDVIWTLDPVAGRYLYVSPAVERLCGYTPDELLAAPFGITLKTEQVVEIGERIALHLAEFAAGTRTSADVTTEEMELRCKDGSTVWAEIVSNMTLSPRTGQVEVRGVARDISERKRAEAQIQHLAHFDQLTGLPNRSLLKDRSRYALSLAQRKGGQLAVMFLDLDHFKNINDSLGHDLGDQLLVEVSRRLSSVLRAGDTVSRLGGDEFVFLLPDTDAVGAGRVAGKLLEAIAQPCVIGRHELNTTPSIGIAVYPDDGSDIDTLSRNADAAMYHAKRDGRNGFRFFTEEMQARSARSLVVATALRHALEREQFSLHFQPQVSLHSGRIVGAEALLRWTHPELGAVSPAEFVPVAESTGLIVQIGEWVLRRAVSEARRWLDVGLPPLVVAVNLSAAQFRHPNLPELVSRILDEAGLPPRQLDLELTEAMAMDDPQAAIEVMDRLFACGIHLSIDDFGTGYSSLGHLKRFKVAKLKIDQSFVRDITEDPDDKAIVTAIINLADSLSVLTVAEGVETRGQLDFLRGQGCDVVQGYYFSKPLPPEAFEAYVRETAARPLAPGTRQVEFGAAGDGI